MARTRNIYDPHSPNPYRISRSKIELFVECPRCFYLDRRLGIDRIPSPGYTLNTATDTLLKKEFDHARKEGKAHRLMEQYHVPAIPYDHPDIDDWRNYLKGISALHEPTNLTIFGAVDDVWVDTDGNLIVVDYKSTSSKKNVEITTVGKSAYRRQMEIYQWILRKMGFKVSNTGYFVYVNCDTDQPAFNSALKFEEQVLTYTGRDAWIEETIQEIKNTLDSNEIPDSKQECPWCSYRADCERLVEEHKSIPATLFS